MVLRNQLQVNANRGEEDLHFHFITFMYDIFTLILVYFVLNYFVIYYKVK